VTTFYQNWPVNFSILGQPGPRLHAVARGASYMYFSTCCSAVLLQTHCTCTNYNGFWPQKTVPILGIKVAEFCLIVLVTWWELLGAKEWTIVNKIFRSTPSQPNKVGLKCPPRPSVRPQKVSSISMKFGM